MKYKLTFFSLVAILGISLLFTPNGEASAAKLVNTVKPTLEFYDKNDEQIYPYSQEELEELLQKDQTEVDLFAVKKYKIKKSEFSYNLWIGGGLSGKSFKNPTLVILNGAKDITNINITAYNSSSRKKVGTVKLAAPSGWRNTSVPWSHLARGKSYSFELQNKTVPKKRVYLQNGEVWYN